MVTSARVLVVDDHARSDRIFTDAFGANLTVCTSVQQLETDLRSGKEWDVGFIDFALADSGPDQRTGLTVFRLLRAQRPNTKLVSYTQMGESGRKLYIAAVKQWFDADATIDKSMVDTSIGAFVNHVQNGPDPTNIRHKRWLERSDLIDDLLKNERFIEVWRYWHMLNGNQAAIRQITYLSVAQLRAFTETVYEPVMDFKMRFDGVDLRAVPGGRNTNYKGVIGSFASENRLFLAAPDLLDALQAAGKARRRPPSAR